MSIQRFLLVLLLVLFSYSLACGQHITPKIDLLKSQVTELVYANNYQTAHKSVSIFLESPTLSPVEIFYGHFLLADVTKSAGNPKKAIELLQKSKSYLKALNQDSKLFESLIYGNISECYFNTLDFNNAQKYALMSLEMSPDSSLRGSGHAVNNIIIGYSNFIIQKYDLALKHYEYAAMEYLRLGDICELPLSYIKIAKIYWIQGKAKQAKKILDRALFLSDSCSIRQYKLLSTIALFKFYKHNKQYKHALNLVDSVTKLRAVIYNHEQQKIVRDLEVKYQTQLTLKENDNLKKSVSLQEKNGQFKVTALIGSILFLLLLLILGFFTLRMRKNKHILLRSQLQKIETQNKERETLLKEIHHRVKNNLQVITSLLHLQANQKTDKTIDELVDKSQYRINAMVMVHEMLYQSDNLSKINLHNYLQELVQSLLNLIKDKHHQITFDLQTPSLYLGLDTAIPLGLLINEIITNSLLHGLKEEGEIYIHVSHKTATSFTINIGDNGIGCLSLSFEGNNSLGLKLMKKLSRQLLGSIEIDPSKEGCHYIIAFQETE